MGVPASLKVSSGEEARDLIVTGVCFSGLQRQGFMIAQANLKLTLEPRLGWTHNDPQTTQPLSAEIISINHHDQLSSFFSYYKNNIYTRRRKTEWHLENEITPRRASPCYILVCVSPAFLFSTQDHCEDAAFAHTRACACNTCLTLNPHYKPVTP